MKDCISIRPSMRRRFEIRSVWSTTEDFRKEVLFFIYLLNFSQFLVQKTKKILVFCAIILIFALVMVQQVPYKELKALGNMPIGI